MNRTDLIIATFACLTMVAHAACWEPIICGGFEPYYGGFIEPALDVDHDGELAGAFGGFERDEPTAAAVTSHGEYGGALVEVIAADSRGAGMIQLSVSGNLEDIPSGTSQTFHIEDDPAVGGFFIVATGCAGDTPDEWLEDELATEVTVTATDVPSQDGMLREYAFEAVFPTYTNTWDVEGSTALTGSFRVFHVTP